MSEEGIDMERCMQGVDDEAAWIPKINWVNCAEQMPPDDVVVIVKSWTGNLFRITNYALGMSTSLYGAENYSWTEFTKEKWEALNK